MLYLVIYITGLVLYTNYNIVCYVIVYDVTITYIILYHVIFYVIVLHYVISYNIVV